MAKRTIKKVKEVDLEKESVEGILTVTSGEAQIYIVPKIQPITETFGNADMNVLKDKINEIIAEIIAAK